METFLRRSLPNMMAMPAASQARVHNVARKHTIERQLTPEIVNASRKCMKMMLAYLCVCVSACMYTSISELTLQLDKRLDGFHGNSSVEQEEKGSQVLLCSTRSWVSVIGTSSRWLVASWFQFKLLPARFLVLTHPHILNRQHPLHG